jgi:hypothetical protein
MTFRKEITKWWKPHRWLSRKQRARFVVEKAEQQKKADISAKGDSKAA